MRAKRIIYNGNQNTSTDYIPLVNGQQLWAYVNGVRIPHWVAAAKRPTVNMTSNTTPAPYVADRSSRYGPNYEAWKAFNTDIADQYGGWVSDSTDPQPWIQLRMDVGLKNIYIVIKNRQRSTLVNGAKAGIIYGSDDGANLVQIGSFSGRNGATSALATTHYCNNYNDSYQYVRLVITDWERKGMSTDKYMAIGELEVYGKIAV